MKKAVKKAKKQTESRDALHNARLDESSEFMHGQGRRLKRRNTRAKAPSSLEPTAAKPAAIPIRQPQLHSEN